MSDIDYHQPATSTDAQRITNIVTRLQEEFPTATRFGVTSSDQGTGGFIVTHVVTPAGQENVEPVLEEELFEDASWLGWGCFGDRNSDSTFEVDMTTHRIVR